ncbi:substrate of the Dot/Icm secretion system [Anopheles sinensis]|uniref:Substrate of the Dot/Icm secretion system n=1 Tax=Anopheles sinensis TaxID=74873 RepID=A0A084VRV8_ANOSI|nr:substrate of the Dot/Icm secretion system [Anopheles sinensis]
MHPTQGEGTVISNWRGNFLRRLAALFMGSIKRMRTVRNDCTNPHAERDAFCDGKPPPDRTKVAYCTHHSAPSAATHVHPLSSCVLPSSRFEAHQDTLTLKVRDSVRTSAAAAAAKAAEG